MTNSYMELVVVFALSFLSALVVIFILFTVFSHRDHPRHKDPRADH